MCLKVFLRPDEEIRDEVANDVIRRTLWLDDDAVVVRVDDGIVTLAGDLEQRSLIPVLLEMVASVEGVVAVENHLGTRVEERPDRQSASQWSLSLAQA